MILRFITNKNQFKKQFDFSNGKSELKIYFFFFFVLLKPDL